MGVPENREVIKENIQIPANWPNDQNKLCFSLQNIFTQSECDWLKSKTDLYFEEEKKDDEYFLSVIREDAEITQFVFDKM